jgi:hypothetical protein
MKSTSWVTFTLAIHLGAAGVAAGQASTPGDPPASPPVTGTSDAGSAAPATGEPTLPPEHLGGTQAPPSVAPSPGNAPAANEPLVLDSLRLGSNDRIELYMFGDVSAIAQHSDVVGVSNHSAFTIGELGLQITAHLAPGLVGRMESALSYNDQYGTDIDMERVYLEYRITNWIISAGRTHAELGYWNNAFHHGRWLQLTIARPRVLRFEDDGGMLPIHHVGVTIEHAPARGEQGLDVVLAVGNGHGPTLLGIQTNADDNEFKSLLMRVGGVGFAHGTLRFGVNAMVDRISAETFGMPPMPVYPLLPNTSMLEMITGVYFALRSERLLVFSETYNVLHQGGGKSWDTTDGFVVAGMRFDKLIPYGQLEVRRGDGATDPFYNPDPMAAPEAQGPVNFVEGIAGLHYDLNPWSAIKLELGARNVGSGPDNGKNDYRAEINWSFGR